MRIPFLDLSREGNSLRGELSQAFMDVLDWGRFVLDREVEGFERAFADYCGASHCVAVASGSDAIELALRAVGVKSGDEVVTSALTAVPTVAAISATGATPVLADVDEATLTLDPEQLEGALTDRTRAIVPVHLYGQSADMDSLLDLVRDRDIHLIEDAAQAHGAEYRDQRVGSLGAAAAFSFYPTKNLGALGDSGAVVTSDASLAERVRILRTQGEESGRGAVVRATHSRMDEIQAALLSVKLSRLEEWNQRRRELALRYLDRLEGTGLRLPVEAEGRVHAWHLFVVQTRGRDRLRSDLASRGVGCGVHYEHAIHHHPAYTDLARSGESLARAERAAASVLSLPLYPELSDRELDDVAAAVTDCVAESSAS